MELVLNTRSQLHGLCQPLGSNHELFTEWSKSGFYWQTLYVNICPSHTKRVMWYSRRRRGMIVTSEGGYSLQRQVQLWNIPAFAKLIILKGLAQHLCFGRCYTSKSWLHRSLEHFLYIKACALFHYIYILFTPAVIMQIATIFVTLAALAIGGDACANYNRCKCHDDRTGVSNIAPETYVPYQIGEAIRVAQWH